MQVKKSIYTFLFLVSIFGVSAETGEQSRILVHTLNYIGHDYQFGVKDGKVISEDEYDEALEFGESAVKYCQKFSANWTDEDSIEISGLVKQLDSLIDSKASSKDVAALASVTKQKVIKASGLTTIPSKFPSLEAGKIIFRTECSKCHGNFGLGDGLEGKGLNPAPRNFHDNERMKSIAPFSSFNTIRLGVEGTGMKAHPGLEDQEVWDLAFYITALRYQKNSNNPKLNSGELRRVVDSISLEKIASTTDEDFLKLYPQPDSISANLLLSAIRLKQPKPGESEFINTSLRYLDGAMELYLQGKNSEASQLAALSYLEGIEPIETQLKASDPALMSKLEEQMQHLRKMLEESHSLTEVNDSISALRTTITQASELLNKKDYSFWMALFMATSVLLREGLEAFLVIMVILSVLKATNLKDSRFWVHTGWMLAVILGIILWFISGSFLKEQMQHVELIEGIISMLAVAMLLYVGFWLHGKSEATRWKEYVSRMMKGVVDNGSLLGLAGLSFFVVFREVFESVLFLSALNVESEGKQTAAILSGVIAAFIIVLVFAFLVLQFSTKLPIPKLFKISSLVMAVLALVLVGKGIHSFQVTSVLPIHGLPLFRFEPIGFYPTVETCLAQLVVLIIVVIIWNASISASAKK